MKTFSKTARALLGREPVKLLLSPLLKWPRRADLHPGYDIILGVPWHLRHLLEANLMFLDRLDRSNLRAIHIVLDRSNPAALDDIRAGIADRFEALPLKYHCYSGLAGTLIERIDVSTFYNSMNCVTALSKIQSTHAILHDFDLYPLRWDYFERIYKQMVNRSLHYCGVELTHFDGLVDADRVLGTWGLGMDVGWLRERHAPIEIFHAIRRIRGRWTTLDPFSNSQLLAGHRRELVDGAAPSDFCHVKNLCSSYLRFSTGRHAKVAWRLHYLWYLESMIGGRDLEVIQRAMEAASGLVIEIDGTQIDFAGTDPTCANVLDTELERMERSLHGTYRPQIREYVEQFRCFLSAG